METNPRDREKCKFEEITSVELLASKFLSVNRKNNRRQRTEEENQKKRHVGRSDNRHNPRIKVRKAERVTSLRR